MTPVIKICQRGFNDADDLLLNQNGLPSVREFVCFEIKQIHFASGDRNIINNFSDKKIGSIHIIKKINVDTKNQKMLVIEDCPKKNAITILI